MVGTKRERETRSAHGGLPLKRLPPPGSMEACKKCDVLPLPNSTAHSFAPVVGTE